MSLRGSKRSSGARGEEPSTSKRRRTEPEDPLWALRPVSDLKMSSIYNRGAPEAPAELFRKDLISAMKLPDSEPLTSSEYWIVTDTWKQDWERGVQVPVNPDSLPAPKVKIIDNPQPPDFTEFKLPKDKYIHLSRDPHYQSEKHHLSTTPAKSDACCSYDLDAIDIAWLKLLNAERARAGAAAVTEDQLERVIEELEVRTWDKIQAIIKSEEGLGIEYDENVICDVCRSPDSEDGNEMVFCDLCNICVHQACYGITVIPDGQWLCRPCGDRVRPKCVLCPNQGGAMKCTPSGHKWAHVSCVLWIPEVSIGCAEKMEPITKITSIPTSRWSLVCVLCRERKGACIQCSVKTCKTAYHVTCAFKHGLEMRAIIEDENAEDGVKLRSYCQKHSVNSKKEKSAGSGSEEEEVKRKRRKDMTSEEKTQARAARLQEIEREFDKHVSVKDISTHLLDVDQDAINYIYNYWKLKRRAGRNRPLLPPKSDDCELLTHRQEQADLDKMRMFVQLRQDLERVRNLCYMVSRREKLSRTFFRMREQTFHKQVAVLSVEGNLTGPELKAIVEANHGPSIYDRLYSHPDAPDHKNDFEEMLARIAPAESGDEKKKDRNGMVKGPKGAANPYKKLYVNGTRRSGSMFSGLSSEESGTEMSRSTRYRGRAIGSTTDEDVKKPSTSPKKKVSPKTKGKKSPKKIERKKKKTPQSKAIAESSSEDEILKVAKSKDVSHSKTLRQMEQEMAAGKDQSTDSDELITIRSSRIKFPADIYSDTSDDETGKEKGVKVKKVKSQKIKAEKSPGGNDSQQSLPRTKAAMKEFILTKPEKKSPVAEVKPAPKKRGRKPSNKEKKVLESDDEDKKENIKAAKQQKDNPTDLIVPQRQAAKKASENMRSSKETIAKKEELVLEKQTSDSEKVKPKIKSKGKEVKEKESPIKGHKKSKEIEKEPIAYVPQRQAAKKAAAHIKSGLGTKAPVAESSETEKKKEDNAMKLSPKKEETKSIKTPVKDEESSTSSSNSCTSCSTSSSSEEEHEKPEMKPTAKAREIKPVTKQQSLFSPPGPRPTVDLPFLDRVSRPLSSTSASSDSDSSQASRYSGSSSPIPKRPRRRRKGKSLSGETSPRKAPDKKLKTSERGTECGVPSTSAEREESSRPGPARAATRARTRSTTAGGNMSHKPDAGQRKSSGDDIPAPTSGHNQTLKESRESSELPIAERKENEAIKKEIDETKPLVEAPKVEKVKSFKNNRRSISIDDKDKIKPLVNKGISPVKSSPRKVESKQKSITSRRQSVKEPPPKVKTPRAEDIVEPIKQRRMSRVESKPTPERKHSSPVKKLSVTEKPIDYSDVKSPRMLHDLVQQSRVDNDKWMPKAPSPTALPPPVEKRGDHQKYMSEDKSFDSDSTDKTSIKMIAKIQANLNENTMIKSPKTPMDARSINMEIMEVDNAMPRNIRKRSILDPDKKYITQDASHVQGVEISKSAKIPSAANLYPNRSIFSPQSKENELFDFDLLNADDGFNQDIIQPFTSYPDISFFKEDSKEQGVQETMNLVDRLRLQLSTKKPPPETAPQDEPPVVDGDKEKSSADKGLSSESMPSEQLRDQHVPQSSSPQKKVFIDPAYPKPGQEQLHTIINHKPHPLAKSGIQTSEPPYSKDQPLPMTSSRWIDMPTPQHHSEPRSDQKFDHTIAYSDDLKEPLDVQSSSEVGDSISLSKQSDDSQSVSVVDHSIPSNDPELTQDNNNYDNNNSLILSDCATISSPYASQDSKWRESKITMRRSSASSSNSEGSVCSQKSEMKMQVRRCESQASGTMEMETYQSLRYPCGIETGLPQFPAYGADPSSFVPLFGPHAPLPPGPLFHPPLSFPGAPLLPPMPKPTFPALCATFTTSSQNLALTAAMIAPPTPKPIDSPRDDDNVTVVSISDKFSAHTAPSPSPSPSISVCASMDSYTESSSLPASNKALESERPPSTSLSIAQEIKSSPRTKTPRFGKSPGKSPAGISPKQSEGKSTKRSNNKSNRSTRGRGRSKSRASGVHVFPPADYMSDSIQSKLVGTPYDFDKEIANDGVDLKSLRERRKSVDVRDERKSDAFKDRSRSPQGRSSPVGKRADVADGKTGSPESFSNVAPVLPGPVDMRNYQGFAAEATAAPAALPVVYHSHLLDFTTGSADQQLADIDEEVEKQLHSALMASKPGPACSPPRAPDPPPVPKVSLSDPRNQLKVKIKGPFLDANYMTSSMAPPPAAQTHDTTTTIIASSTGGSTNLRRMRKKELLYQYNQDKNNDPSFAPFPGAVPPPTQPPPLARAVITIPKAVASMTSIPTREDYKISDPSTDKRRRKSGGNRELRQLSGADDDDKSGRRRARAAVKTPGAPPPTNLLPTTPKLKIKIGQNVVQPVTEESSAFQFRPPKKRHLSVPVPDFKALRRDMMKYRREVMADFAETKKKKKYKPSKSEKHKKKKDKKCAKEKLQVVNSESESATKLIIKIKRTKEEEEGASGSGPSAAAAAAPEPTVDAVGPFDPLEPDPLALDPPSHSEASSSMRKIRTAKVTPIRLKLSRSAQGYVTADSGQPGASSSPPDPARPVR